MAKPENIECWCGSGKKNKHCHGRRESERRIPDTAASRKFIREGQTRVCMHFDAKAGHCSKVIQAHSIQKNGTLAGLTDSTQHLRCFDRTMQNQDGLLALQRMGWKEASTFSGFCGLHDAALFSPIENRPFEADPQQRFLLGYRALCHEWHRRTCTITGQSYLRQAGDRGLPHERQLFFQQGNDTMAVGLQSGMKDIHLLKQRMDDCLRTGQFGDWSSVVLSFSGALSVSGCGVVSPNRDINGNALQDLNRLDLPLDSLLCNVVGTKTGGAMVFLWSEEATAPAALIRSVLACPRDAILSVLVQFMFAHISNMYFADNWWEKLRPAQKVYVQQLASIPSAYSIEMTYRTRASLVPWTLTDVVEYGPRNCD